MIKKYLFIILLFFSNIFANEELVYSSSYFITEKNLTLEEIKNVKIFTPSQGNNFGIIDEYCWLKIEIKNNTNKKITQIVEFKIPFLDYINVYKPNQAVEKYGQLYPFNTSLKSMNNAAFKINLNENELQTIYVKIKSSFAMKTFFQIFNENEYENNLIFYKRIFDFIYGILFCMVVYNFFMWLSLREQSYLYYVLFHFFFLLGIISWTGIGFEYIWYDKPWINYYSYGILGNLIYAFNIYFIIYYLDTQKHIPKVTQYLKLSANISLLFAVSSVVLPLITLYEIFSLITTLFSLSVIIYLIFARKLVIAKYILISKVFLLLGNYTLILSELGIVNGSFFIDNSYIWGVAIEVILMSFALSYKYKDLQKEKAIESLKRVETEELLLEKQKLAFMGEMMNTMVHQWRQPLGQVNAVLCKLENEYYKNQLNDESLQNKINDIESITNYLSNTINDFRNFSLPSSEKTENIETIFREIESIVNFIYKSHEIQLSINYPSKDERIHINKNLLIQVFLIILTNAKDALIENKTQNPQVTITTKKTNRTLQLDISNNGGAISPNIISKIFDSHFTTKSNNDGTGLGLYIAKIIVEEKLQGKLSVSTLNESTSFHILLKNIK